MPIIESLMDAQTPTVEPSNVGVRTYANVTADAADFGGQIGQALGGFGEALSQFAQIRARDQQQLQGFQRQKAWQDFMGQEQERLMTAKRGITNGADAFTQSYVNGTTGQSASSTDAAGVPSPAAGNEQDRRAAAGPTDDGGLNGRVDAWLNANMPADADPKERAQWEAQAAEFKRTMGVQALEAEFNARDQYYKTTIGGELQRISASITSAPSGIDNYIKQGEQIIDASGLSAEDKITRKAEWRNEANLAYGLAKATSDPDGVATAMGSPKAGYYAKVANHESGGSQQNGLANGNNGGLYQFEPGTWAQIANSPEGKAAGLTADGKSDEAQQQTAIRILTQGNAKALSDAGLPTTEKNLYLAHFLGSGGAVDFLKAMNANPNDPAVNHVSSGAASSNASIFYDKDGKPRSLAEVYNIQTKEFSGQTVSVSDPHLADMPFEAQQHVLGVAETQSGQQAAETARQQTQDHQDWFNNFLLGIHDGSANKQDIEMARATGKLTDFNEITRAEQILAERDAQTAALARYGAKTAANEGFNQFDPEDRAAANAAVTAAQKNGEDPFAAGLRVYQKTGIVPDAVVPVMRGALLGQDPAKAQSAASIAGNMVADRPNAFAGVANGEEIEKAGITFNHLTNDLGMAAADATKRIQELNSTAYQSSLKIDDKEAKDFSDGLRKNALTELPKAFGSYISTPAVFDAKQRGAMAADYAELATQRYQETGDKSEAKAYALQQMKKLWGVSNGYLMKFPPDNIYPAAADGTHNYIYEQAAAAASTASGEKIDPKNVTLVPVENLTANAWKAGTPPPYTIMYTRNIDGHEVHEVLLRPGTMQGRPWVPDTSHIAEERAKASAAAATEFRQNVVIKNATNAIIPPGRDFTEGANPSPFVQMLAPSAAPKGPMSPPSFGARGPTPGATRQPVPYTPIPNAPRRDE